MPKLSKEAAQPGADMDSIERAFRDGGHLRLCPLIHGVMLDAELLTVVGDADSRDAAAPWHPPHMIP